MAEKLWIEQLVVGPIETNCYLLRDGEDGREAVIVDPGDDAGEIAGALEELRALPQAILLTHGHYDHILAVNELKKRYPDCLVYIGEHERAMVEDSSLNGSFLGEHDPIAPDVYLKDNEEISLIGRTFRVIGTPGHTAGSVSYYAPEDKVLFSGDTLFFRGMGRTDLPTGNAGELFRSLKRLFAELPPDTEVCPGHGRATVLELEKGNEDYLL